MQTSGVVAGLIGLGAAGVVATAEAAIAVVGAVNDAAGGNVNALDIIGTGSQLTVVGVLVLIAHRFATGQLVSRDTAAALARMDELTEQALERERHLEDLKVGARIREDRLWQLATTGPHPDVHPPPPVEPR